MEFTVQTSSPFNLEHTLESGQVFRWWRNGEWWQGVVAGTVLKVKQEGEVLRCQSGREGVDGAYVSRYFRLDEDLEGILATIMKDDAISRACQKFYGLRLIRQDRWECLASFVLATNANIPRIKKMVASVCSRYGERFEFEGDEHHAFPPPDSVAAARVSDLTACGLGYRAPFLKKVAGAVSHGRIDFTALDRLGYEDARELLLKELQGEKILLGVGPKVADCILLYSCGKDGAFPIDVWIARVLAESYPKLLGRSLRRKYAADKKVKLSPSDYSEISARARAYFGEYAGYAQQYLFMAARAEESV